MRPPHSPRTAIFYGNPKTHKPNIPLRPIASAIDNPTDNLSKYIAHFLHPLSTLTDTYIKDSTTFKKYIAALPPLPTNAYLCTADVKSLYTNIPTAQGIEHTCAFIDTHRNTLPSYAPNTHIFKIILTHILTHSTFKFQDTHYLQHSGAAMGNRMVPPYANIFMHYVDIDIKTRQDNIDHFKRFLDDLFFIFYDDDGQIDQLEHTLNTIHPTIKFTLSHSRTDINFLDLHIYLDNDRKLRTTFYRKRTDCQSYIHFTSNHPLYIKRNIIYTQALRLNKLIDDDTELRKHLDMLTKSFIIQAYPLQFIHTEIQKALQFTQHELLNPPPPTEHDPTAHHNTVKIQYSTSTRPLKNFFRTYESHMTDTSLTQNQPTPPHLNTVFTNHKK